MNRMQRWVITALALGCASALGCSSARSIPWRAEMSQWFGNTVRSSSPPYRYWTPADETLLLQRIGHADVAIIGSVRAVTVSRHLRSTIITLSVHPEEPLRGNLEQRQDQQGRILLPLDYRSRDFRLALAEPGSLLGRRLLVLVKDGPLPPARPDNRPGWYASLWPLPPAEPPEPFWAVYPVEPQLLNLVQPLYRDLHDRE